jgi:hypothetical protein
MTKYKVYRYSEKGAKKLVRKNLTLADAQLYCKRPDTHGKGWFCGYVEM